MQALSWPANYLPDLLKGRKPLTLARAIQCATFFKLGLIDFEKLIYLAILNVNEISGEKRKLMRVACSRGGDDEAKDFDTFGMRGLNIQSDPLAAGAGDARPGFFIGEPKRF